MAVEKPKAVNKKRINRAQLMVFYMILYWDKFKYWLLRTSAAKGIQKIISKIRDLFRWYLHHPDEYFERKWEENEFYPFTLDEHDQFVCRVRDRWFYPVTVVFMVAICYAIIRAYFYGQVNDFMCHLVIIVTGVTSLILWQKQQLIIDMDTEVYVIIWYNTILCNDPIHNIFLRILEFRGSPADKPYYQLILQASKLPAVSITRLSREAERIRRIGHMLAEKLNLNFFECEDVSHNHIIRHWPVLPLGEDLTTISPPPKTDFFQSKTMKTLFDASSDLTKNAIYELEKMVGGQKESTPKPPTDTVPHIDLVVHKPREVIEHIKRSAEGGSKLEEEEIPERKTLRRRKPLSFFKSIFPHDKRRKSIPETITDLDAPGPSTSQTPSNLRSRKIPIVGAAPAGVSSTEDDDTRKEDGQDFRQKRNSAQSAEKGESMSITTLSDLTEYLETSGSETDFDDVDEREDKGKDGDRI